MLLGVQHLVRELLFLQQLVDDFGVFNGRRAHQHRLTALIAFTNVFDGCVVFLAGRLVHAVQLVFPAADAVGRNHHGFQAVNFLELVGFGIGRSGHAGKLAVQAEIVLKGDGCQRLVLGLNLHTLFGLYRLVQTVAPASPRHQTAGELINDHDLTVLHNIVLVAVVEMVSTQCGVQVVHQGDVGGVVER